MRTAYKVSYKDNKGDLSQWKVNKEDKFNVGSMLLAISNLM